MEFREHFNELCPCCEENVERFQKLEDELKLVRNLLMAVVSSKAIREAPMLTYSEAFSNACDYLEKNCNGQA